VALSVLCRLSIHSLYLESFFTPLIVFSNTLSDFNLVVNITGAMLGQHVEVVNYCDVEIQGTPQQIDRGLSYLKALNVRMRGKPNAIEEDWY
jgi:L-aspartate semialdehyde sulfurtransferase ferredoxin